MIDVSFAQDTQADKEPPGESSVAERPAVDLSAYRVYLRELDLPVFSVLHLGLITKAALDTDMNTKVGTRGTGHSLIAACWYPPASIAYVMAKASVDFDAVLFVECFNVLLSEENTTACLIVRDK